MSDAVNHPQHYNNGAIECIDAIESACTGSGGYEGFLVGQVVKYVWRYKHKGKPVEDLKKADYYLQQLIQYESAKEEKSDNEKW